LICPEPLQPFPRHTQKSPGAYAVKRPSEKHTDLLKDLQALSIITIERFDPVYMKRPVKQTYEVPLEKGYTVMDAMDYIYQHIDGSLAFRRSCRCGLCYVCRIRINGKARCPCKTYIQDKIFLAPLSGKKVIRDLVVELD